MNKNSWIIWALVLMIPGAVGLGYHLAHKRSQQEQVARAVETTAATSTTNEYLKMYEDWHRLTPEEKSENPWGQDPYGGPEIQKRLQEGQSARLTADLSELEKGFKQFPEELANTLYGSGWRQAIEDYRRQRSKAEMLLIGSVFLLAGGGLLLVGGVVKTALCFSLSRLKGNAADEPDGDTESEPASKAVPEEPSTETPETEYTSFRNSRPVSDMEKVIASSRAGKQTSGKADEEKGLGYFESRKKNTPKEASSGETPRKEGPLSVLSRSLAPAAVMDKPTGDSYFGWALREEESAAMETLMTPEPLTKELTELTEEVSAIRQFAAQQQDQVRKLQDGYDWMIIRRFCMRIIRSIDNIEDRIGRLEETESELAQSLEDIRDELVFALESSGIEQFNPDLEIPYKGLEKYAEAVRGRVTTEDESRVGCIAEIVRPGYQYLISDDDVKIVRCAQVKLYETQSK